MLEKIKTNLKLGFIKFLEVTFPPPKTEGLHYYASVTEEYLLTLRLPD